MEKMKSCQCELKKGNEHQVTWIPKKYAKLGKFLKLIDDDGWEVIKIFEESNYKEINNRSMDYKNQRKVSDI